MRYFVYVSEECKNDAKNLGFFSDLKNLEEKVEIDQSIASWDLFLPYPIIKKSLGKTGRLIAIKHPVNDDIVVCFIKMLSRGDSKYYSQFLGNPNDYCSKIGLDIKDVSRTYKDKLDSERVPEPQEPSEEEYEYLYNRVCSLDTSDGIIYESKDWVKRINDQEVVEYRSRYFDLLTKNILYSKDGINIIHHSESPVKIVYKKDLCLIQSGDTIKAIFLIAPLLKDEDESPFLKKYSKIIETKMPIQIETLIRESRKSYPAIILAEDETMWSAIESNKEGNLALSPQESNILDLIRHPKPESKIFPLFINGHPGSGKTTILQYLFAEYLYLHLSRETEIKPPLYLTYNGRLLKSARDTVRTLIKCNSNLLSTKINLHDQSVIKTFINCFVEFHEFLLNLLTDDIRSGFSESRRVDFIRFKQLWFKRGRSESDPRIQNFSPELIWHVIRTYIKGMCNDEGDYLDIESYEELPESKRTVLVKDYKLIYDVIWDRWYFNLCKSNGYWDDQDLTRAVLDNCQDNISVYPAIFCDESQDFTRNELELIFKLNLFSKRDVKPYQLKHISFVFAGDPFQTLNPTGFDWDMVKNSFYEQIIQELDKNGKAQLDFNYGELNLNYRSTKCIVSLCNTIHLLRGILFCKKNLIPQRYWFDEDADEVFYFDIADNKTMFQMKSLSDLVIIVPCQENEEEDFIKGDTELLALQEETKESFTCFSPMSVKGSEFPRVVLYKFADDYLKNHTDLLTPLESGIDHLHTPEKSIPLEYYINRLYVAASRAQQNLIIVDTKEGIEKFWHNPLIKDVKTLIGKYETEQTDDWSKSLGWTVKGIPDYWGKGGDPNKIGEILWLSGYSERDPWKLESAEKYFKRANNRDGMLKCRSYRHELTEEFKLAGIDYLEIGENEKALHCFWQDDDCLIDITEHQEFSNMLEYKVASYLMSSKRRIKESIIILESLYHEVLGPRKKKIINEILWERRFGSVIQNISKNTNKNKEWKNIYRLIRDIIQTGLKISKKDELPVIAYFAEEYRDALSYWDKMENPPVSERMYQRAKSIVLPFPKNIEWLYNLDNFIDIITGHEKHSLKTYSPDDSMCIVHSYLNNKNYLGSIEFIEKHPNLSLIEIVESELKKDVNSELMSRLDYTKLSYYIKMDRWENAYSIFKKYYDKEGIFENKIRDNFINQVALSEKFVGVHKSVKTDFAKKLRELYIDKEKVVNLDVRVAGACIEKANKIIDAFEYYELIWKNPKNAKKWTNDEIAFAKARWLRCKTRYVNVIKNNVQISKLKDEIEKFSSSWSIDPYPLPEFPIIKRKPEDSQLDSEFDDFNLSTEQIKSIKIQLKSNSITSEEIAKAMNVPLHVTLSA